MEKKMEPKPSTSKAGTSAAAAAPSGGVPTSSNGDQQAAPPSISGPVQLRQQQLSFNYRASLDQCRQLFTTSCRVKLQRCEVPTPTAAENNATVAVATPTAAEINATLAVATPIAAENNATVAVATPTVTETPADSRTVGKVEEEPHTRNSFSSEDGDIKVLPTPAPPVVAPSSKQKKPAKWVSQEKSPARCRVCRKMFHSKAYLKQHMRIHTGKKRYSCGTCRRSFWFSSAFCYHKKKRDQRNGVCPKEKKRIGGWRPKGAWNCEICGKRMKNATYYPTHMRIHRGEKPFKCGECGKAFVRNNHLTIHKKIHSQVRQFTCVFCERGFHLRSRYWGHLRGHTEEKPYFCEVDGCGASFQNYYGLRKHRRLIH